MQFRYYFMARFSGYSSIASKSDLHYIFDVWGRIKYCLSVWMNEVWRNFWIIVWWINKHLFDIAINLKMFDPKIPSLIASPLNFFVACVTCYCLIKHIAKRHCKCLADELICFQCKLRWQEDEEVNEEWQMFCRFEVLFGSFFRSENWR